MKKVTLAVIIACLILTSCTSKSIGIIGSADGPTKIIVSDKTKTPQKDLIDIPEVSSKNAPVLNIGEQYEKRSVKMFCLDGDLYYDTGIISDITARCGNLDGNLKSTVSEGEIPQNTGEANFDTVGYQNGTGITKELFVDGQWHIFKKYNSLPQNIDEYKYCFYIKGKLNNAVSDSEIIVLTDTESVTFNDVLSPLFSSYASVNEDDSPLISYEPIFSGDSLGITLYAENATCDGITLCFEQFGVPYSGELHFASSYTIEKSVGDDKWQVLTPKYDNIIWNDASYIINKNDRTYFDIDWTKTHGTLEPGSYRINKKVINFISSDNYEEKEYCAYFDID